MIEKLGKKNVILLFILIGAIIVLGSTIAFFGWSSTEEGKDSTIDVAVSSGTGECSKLTDNNKLLVPTSAKEKGRIVTVKAKQELAEAAIITWDLVINRINTESTTTSGLKHESFKYLFVNTTTGVEYGSGNFASISNGSTITLSNSNEMLDYNTEYTFTLYLWIDGTLGNNPIDMSDQTIDFDLRCNITGTEPPTLASTITNLYLNNKDNTLVENNGISYRYASSVRLMNDRQGSMSLGEDAGNIRYYGKDDLNDPDDLKNYIYFNCTTYPSTNCETWRIIGVFDGKIKIMRNSSIEKLTWDQNKNINLSYSNYRNSWSDINLDNTSINNSSLQLFLNRDYYNGDTAGKKSYFCGTSGTTSKSLDMVDIGIKNEATRRLISESTWYLRGFDSASIYPDQAYNYERTTGSVPDSTYPISWNGNIALPYPSDHGYAVDLSQCKNITLGSYSNSTCSNNWMKAILATSNYGWLLTLDFSSTYKGWAVNLVGSVTNSSVYDAFGVVPVLHLNSDVSIVSGDGSSGLPYQISVS